MNKEVTEYLNLVCAMIKDKQIRLSVRGELAGHINAEVTDLRQQGMEEAAAVKLALERMGDPHDIGKQIADCNKPWQNLLPTIAGTVLLLAVLGYKEHVLYLFDLPALLFVLLLTLAFVLIGGFSRLTRLSALVRGRSAALYAGGIGMLVGLINILRNVSGLDQLGPALAFCITSVLYGLIVSAVLTGIAHRYRPLEGSEIRKMLGWEDYQS